jgi:hypothetical protein
MQRVMGLERPAIAAFEELERAGHTHVCNDLHDLHLASGEKTTAQAALERGVKHRDPRAVLTRVGYASSPRLIPSHPLPNETHVFCRQLLDSAEPDLGLATSMLRTVRTDALCYGLLRKMTDESVTVDSDRELTVALTRLKQSNSAYPLRRLRVWPAHAASPQLLTALSPTTSLECLHLPEDVPSYAAKLLALRLKTVPSLRAVDLRPLPSEVGLELLQSRTNWTHITLPCDAEATADATAFAALNRCSFHLSCHELAAAEHLRPWLLNPHLTSLSATCSDAASAFSPIQHCKNLTFLVRFFYTLVVGTPPSPSTCMRSVFTGGAGTDKWAMDPALCGQPFSELFHARSRDRAFEDSQRT